MYGDGEKSWDGGLVPLVLCYELRCCSSASRDGAGGFQELQSCWSNDSTELFLPGR